jgi:hypothetical protein
MIDHDAGDGGSRSSNRDTWVAVHSPPTRRARRITDTIEASVMKKVDMPPGNISARLEYRQARCGGNAREHELTSSSSPG